MINNQKAKFLINAQEGHKHIERATISFVLAASASKTAETAVFVSSDAAAFCVKDGAKGLQHEGMEPIEDLINQFTSNGGKIWLCPVCAKLHGITDADLREGAEIAGAPKAMEFLQSGAHLLA